MKKYLAIFVCFLILRNFPAAAHDHGEVEGASVGPGKGIVELNESLGFKLSAEALKNFDLSLMPLKDNGPWSVPKSAVVRSGEEINVYRLRKGFFRRVDFETVRKADQSLVIDSDDLREGDEIVTVGTGFLRTAELSLGGGMTHGH